MRSSSNTPEAMMTHSGANPSLIIFPNILRTAEGSVISHRASDRALPRLMVNRRWWLFASVCTRAVPIPPDAPTTTIFMRQQCQGLIVLSRQTGTRAFVGKHGILFVTIAQTMKQTRNSVQKLGENIRQLVVEMSHRSHSGETGSSLSI